jgi:hypothetical protein
MTNKSVDIGLVISIHEQPLSAIKIRRFLTWTQMVAICRENMVPNIAFCPLNTNTHPHYLCDSNLVLDISTSNIIGLAFVFYYEDSMVKHLEGMMHAYIVSPFFHSGRLTVTHTQSFGSFQLSYILE